MVRILLAEDDDDMRRFLVKALERAGYDVSDFDNGASAYERLRDDGAIVAVGDGQVEYACCRRQIQRQQFRVVADQRDRILRNVIREFVGALAGNLTINSI